MITTIAVLTAHRQMTLTHTLAVIQVADIGEHGMILSNNEDDYKQYKSTHFGCFFSFIFY